jgi:hypothetical protein
LLFVIGEISMPAPLIRVAISLIRDRAATDSLEQEIACEIKRVSANLGGARLINSDLLPNYVAGRIDYRYLRLIMIFEEPVRESRPARESRLGV